MKELTDFECRELKEFYICTSSGMIMSRIFNVGTHKLYTYMLIVISIIFFTFFFFNEMYILFSECL